MRCQAVAAGWVVVGALLGVSGAEVCRAQAADGVIEVRRGEAQLFVDDFLLASQLNLRRTLHQPRKDDGGNLPMIAPSPGDGLLAYGSIVYDRRLSRYVMFIQEFASRAMFLTTSADGLTWDARTKDELTPVTIDLDLGPLPPDAKGRFGIDLFSCFYDVNDEQYPYKGWLWFANAGFEWEGIWYVRSRDGRNWERPYQLFSGYAAPGDPSCRAITQEGRTVYGPGDVTTFYYDEVEDRFLGLFKFFNPFDVAPGFSSRSRAYVFMDRMDEPFDIQRITHVELMPAMAEWNGDTPYDEYYASTAWRYESQWLGGLKVFHGKGDYPYSAAGCAFMKLLTSRDGLNWQKVPYANDAGVPEVFLANGPEGGNDGRNDGGYISEFSGGPLRVGDELIYYYSSSSYGKNHPRDRLVRGGGIFRSRLRIDGFVSVDWGTLTTWPLAFAGDHLTVNGNGPAVIRVLDPTGNPLATAEVPKSDSLAHPITFDGRMLREVAPAGVVSLQITVEPPGRVYSFAVR